MGAPNADAATATENLEDSTTPTGSTPPAKTEDEPGDPNAPAADTATQSSEDAKTPVDSTPSALPATPAVRIVGRGDVVIVQITGETSAWAQTMEMLSAHLSQANKFFQGEHITLELGEQPVSGPELQEMLNLLAEYEIGLRQVCTSNPKVHQVAQDLGLAVAWQSTHEVGPRINAFSADDNWEVVISGGGQDPAFSVADFQMPLAIIEALAEGIHEDPPVSSKQEREEQAVPAEPDGRIAPAVRSTLMAHPTDPDLVQRISAPPYLYRGTLRSGQIFRHAGSIIIVGDVNPGAQVVSGSDVYVWGRLRGVVHAGAMGDENSLIGALEFDPIQVRIAGHIAMSPRGEANDPGRWFWKRQSTGKPEIARVIKERIVVDQWDAWLPTRQ